MLRENLFFFILSETDPVAISAGETKRPATEREKDGLLLDGSCIDKPAGNCSRERERENVYVGREISLQPVFRSKRKEKKKKKKSVHVKLGVQLKVQETYLF
jgi:hypothetical protein